MDIRRSYSGLSLPDAGDYRIEVRDFGSIERADVEFRPLTVFVGPSNTGKCYLAMLSSHQWGLRQFARVSEPAVPGRGLRWLSAPELPVELASWVSTITEDDDLPPLPDSVTEALRGEIGRGERVPGPL